MFYCSIITIEFEGEIKEDIKNEDEEYCKELFKLIIQVDWSVNIEKLIWNNCSIWKTIKDWLVIFL